MPPTSLDAWQDLFGADTPRQEVLLASDAMQRQFFRRALRMLHSRMQVSQDALGVIVGYSIEEISRIEAGLLSPPLWRAIDLAVFFNTTVEAMCGRAVPTPSSGAADEDDADLA